MHQVGSRRNSDVAPCRSAGLPSCSFLRSRFRFFFRLLGVCGVVLCVLCVLCVGLLVWCACAFWLCVCVSVWSDFSVLQCLPSCCRCCILVFVFVVFDRARA